MRGFIGGFHSNGFIFFGKNSSAGARLSKPAPENPMPATGIPNPRIVSPKPGWPICEAVKARVKPSFTRNALSIKSKHTSVKL